MKIIYTEQSLETLQKMDNSARKIFIKRIEKLATIPQGRHLKFGLPFNVEEVTKQGRIVYLTKEETLYIIRCFATHKEYEKWYKKQF